MAKYSELTEEQKKQFVNKIAKDLNKALYQTGENRPSGGTQEATVASIANMIRTIGGPEASELVDRVSAAKDEKGVSYFKKGGGNLRSALIKDYSFGDEDDILNAFGYATDKFGFDSDQAALAKVGKGLDKSDFPRFGKITSLDDLPEGAGSLVTNVAETERDIPSFYDMGFTVDSKATPAAGTGTGTGTGTSTGPMKDDGPMGPFRSQEERQKATNIRAQALKKFMSGSQKTNPLQEARNKQARLSGADGPYGYKGGFDQMQKDQSILRATRLGQRESDGGFRLRSAAERQARIREGQFNLQEPKRIVMENFRNRYGDGAGGSRLEQEIKQFQKDTGVKDPLRLESETRAKEQMRAFGQTARDRQKTLEKYRVKEPPKFGDEVAALNKKDQARVMALVNKREEEMKKKKKPVR